VKGKINLSQLIYILLLSSLFGLSAYAKKVDYVFNNSQKSIIRIEAPIGLVDIWKEIKETEISLVKEIKTGNLDKIHNYSLRISKLAESLLEHTSGLSDKQLYNIKSTVRQISETTDRFHEYGDQGDLANTIKEGRKIKKLLRYLEAQYPNDTLSKALG